MTSKRKPSARGRPQLPQGEAKTRTITFRATDAEYDKWHRLGGSVWNREAIRKAKEPK